MDAFGFHLGDVDLRQNSRRTSGCAVSSDRRADVIPKRQSSAESRLVPLIFGTCCSGRATRKPTMRKPIAVATAPRDAERRCHGAKFHDPPRMTRRLQSPVVHAEPSFGAPT